MIKDSFFDTSVIIHYASFSNETKTKIIRQCYEYILGKKGAFFVCYFIERELFNVIKKRAILHKEVLKKLENENYDLDKSEFLYKKDIPFAKKLYSFCKGQNKEEVSKNFLEERQVFEMKIEQFLKTQINEIVIPIEQIKNELVNLIRGVIENYADCNVLASALQFQQTKNTFLFVTADKEDFNPNQYDYLKDYGDLAKYKFPELYNFHFIN